MCLLPRVGCRYLPHWRPRSGTSVRAEMLAEETDCHLPRPLPAQPESRMMGEADCATYPGKRLRVFPDPRRRPRHRKPASLLHELLLARHVADLFSRREVQTLFSATISTGAMILRMTLSTMLLILIGAV